MTRIEQVIRAVSDLREFYKRVKKGRKAPPKRKVSG